MLHPATMDRDAGSYWQGNPDLHSDKRHSLTLSAGIQNLALSLQGRIIVRPPLLLRQGSDRPLEVWAGRVLRLANRFGLLRRQTPIATAQVARRMIALALECPVGLHVLEGPELQERPRH